MVVRALVLSATHLVSTVGLACPADAAAAHPTNTSAPTVRWSCCNARSHRSHRRHHRDHRRPRFLGSESLPHCTARRAPGTAIALAMAPAHEACACAIRAGRALGAVSAHATRWPAWQTGDVACTAAAAAVSHGYRLSVPPAAARKTALAHCMDGVLPHTLRACASQDGRGPTAPPRGAPRSATVMARVIRRVGDAPALPRGAGSLVMNSLMTRTIGSDG